MADFGIKFEWDVFAYFGRSTLICVILHENVEIIYLLAKNEVLVNEKLKFKVDCWNMVYVGGKLKLSLSHLGNL